MTDNMSTKDLIKEINQNLQQRNSSAKDEVTVMRSMLNDPTYQVMVYHGNGDVTSYNPCEDYRNMCAGIIASTTKIPMEEAINLANSHTASKAEAKTMVNVSKEFINTYLTTGRKLSLGGREKSNVSLSQKEIPETVRSCPHKDENGNYSRVDTVIKAHNSIRVQGSCPKWVKNKK